VASVKGRLAVPPGFVYPGLGPTVIRVFLLALVLCAAACHGARNPVVSDDMMAPQETRAGPYEPESVEDCVAELASRPHAEYEVRRRRDRYAGTFTMRVANDTFAARDDDKFTAGTALAWTSAPVRTLGPRNALRGLASDWSFLPLLGDAAFDKFVQISLGFEFFTPADILVADPAPGEHPYAGVLSVDTAVYAIGDRSMHGYIVRIGLVGPAVQAGPLQKWLHDVTESRNPAGWDSQLDNEPILNLFYIYQRRLFRWNGWGARGPGVDAAVNAGAGLGNYYIGANGGLQLRFGIGLPANFERSHPMRLFEEVPGRYDRDRAFALYAFAQGSAVAIGRFLPTDGNTFQDSPSADRDDFAVMVIAGLVFEVRRFTLTVLFNSLGATALGGTDGGEHFTTITASWTF